MTILILDEVDFIENNTSKDKGLFSSDEGLIHKKITTTILLLNIYAASNRISKYMKEKLIKWHGEIDKCLFGKL